MTMPIASRARALCCAVCLIVLVAEAPQRASAQDAPVVFDGVAAVVGGSGAGPGVDVILRSDVEFRARLLLSGTRARLVEGPLPSYWLAQALEQMIGESLIAREAERVRVVTPTVADQRAERAHLEELAGGSAQLVAVMNLMRVSQAELDRVVRRRAAVAVFLTANLERVTLITEAEIERAYEQLSQERAADQRPQPPLDEVRELLRAQLARAAMESTVAQWVTTLRTRTTVRVLADYVGEEQGA